jgi:tetratricopeptide (TPR) repeat protein
MREKTQMTRRRLRNRRIGRAALLALSLLSACAAAEPAVPTARRLVRPTPNGAFGAFLDGRFAVAEGDPDHAADAFLRALAGDPTNTELTTQAFAACLLAGRPDALRLARKLPDSQPAQLLLGDADAKAGNWDAAEAKFHALPHQGLTQILAPILVAWAQQGGGHTDAALATLRPYAEGTRFRGVYALHSALIADIAGRTADASRLYRVAQTDYGGMNLRLAQELASWQVRQGHKQEAETTIRSLTEGSDEMSIAIPSLLADAQRRPVAKATDGIAEAYLSLAAAFRQQDATEQAVLLLRLALDLRPDYAAARILLADIMSAGKHDPAALAILAAVPADDPVIGVVRLRRAAIEERLGHSDTAMHDLEQIAHDYPASALPYAQEGDALRARNRYPEAVVAYDRAIARQGETPVRSSWPLFYARGIAHERAHQWPKAEADFERALELAPEQPYVLNYLAYSWADQGTHLSRAKAMIERAAELRPNDGSIIDSLGWVLLRQGDTPEAVRTLERAVEIEPEDSTINGHLGDAYWAAGRKREAQFQWRRALTLNPEPEDVAKLEAKLHDNASPDGPATAEHHVQ